VLDILTGDLTDDVSVQLDHIGDEITLIKDMIEKFKQICEKSSRHLSIHKEHILNRLVLLIDNLEEVHSDFQNFLRLEQRKDPNLAMSTVEQSQSYNPSLEKSEHSSFKQMEEDHIDKAKEQAQAMAANLKRSMKLAEKEEQISIDVDRRKLREAIVKQFSNEDLESLCADIQQALRNDGINLLVNLEIIEAGRSRRNKVLKLIEYLDKYGYLDYLVAAIEKWRMDIFI
jgi:hypothetical protein